MPVTPYHLPNAPIKEAIINIQIKDADIDPKSLDLSIEGFSQSAEISEAELRVQPQPAGVMRKTESHSHIGYRLESDDGKNILQIRKQGVTVSQFAPYTEWADLCNLAQAVWSSFKADAGKVEVVRTAVRYINVLRIPYGEGGLIDFDQYIHNAPQLPPDLGDEIDHFLTRVVLSLKTPLAAIAIINQTIERPTEDHLPLVLDIDVFSVFEQDSPNDVELWTTFGGLHDAKNRIFFSAMTPTALKLCE